LDSLNRLVNGTHGVEPMPIPPDDYQDLVALVLEFPAAYRQVVEAELRRLFTERERSMEQLQQVRSELAEMADRYTAIVRFVEQASRQHFRAGKHHLLQTTLAQLAEAVANLQQDKARLTDGWPVCSPEELGRLSAEGRQGHFQPVDEAFAEMKG